MSHELKRRIKNLFAMLLCIAVFAGSTSIVNAGGGKENLCW